MLKKTSLFLLAVLIQVLIVASVPGKQIYARMTGRLITIKTAPVDPYSILSGYYVNLRYQISRSPKDDPNLFKEQGEHLVYVVLKEDPNKIWIIDSVNKQPPTAMPSDKVLIKGAASYNQITYGIESYFIPEDKRNTIENDLRNNRDKIYAQIKVDKFGNAALINLHIGDTVYEY